MVFFSPAYTPLKEENCAGGHFKFINASYLSHSIEAIISLNDLVKTQSKGTISKQ